MLSIVGLLFLTIALYFTAVGSILLIMWCLVVAFVCSLVSLVLFAISLYCSRRIGKASIGRKISCYAIPVSLMVLGYASVVVVLMIFHFAFAG
ncbi:hypothetical protein EMB92_09395 [Bifidobacterium callitrichos]|uniref:Uncharacterized protein n=1 Tax=Bifidobacterium callitrichos TaxID=762209 RepID=A0A5M9ZC29_9BIFI|nr:hypothetical protein EMB92_09395 [Bifidobacterium callitrichos]